MTIDEINTLRDTVQLLLAIDRTGGLKEGLDAIINRATATTEPEKALLDEYAAEISDGYLKTTTIDVLIDSHRTLRNWSRQNNDERNAEMARVRERVAEETRQSVQHGEYIEVAKLRKMTIDEIFDLIGYPK